MITDVLPPHDDITEAGALACIVSANNGEGASMLRELTEGDFYDHRHRTIHGALVALRDAGKPLDVTSLYLCLNETGKLEEAGGPSYVQALPEATPSPAQWPSWLAGVQDYSQRRADLAESVRLRCRALNGTWTKGAEDGDDVELARLAALPLLDYERQREDAAKRLGCRAAILDKMVAAKRPKAETAESELQGSRVELPDVELWPEAVEGAAVLSEIAETFGCYIALPDGAADALALWMAQAHAFKAFLCSPRLNINSPEKRCGKTTLRDVIAVLVPRPLLTENLSVAVLFRLVDAQSPTILADECDAWLRDNEELRGLLNAGHRRGGVVYRCEGDGHEVRSFRVFAPAVLCGIGSLPGTLYDRSIVVRLERAKPGELSKLFDPRRVERETELCRKLARWCADNAVRLEACDPALPPGAFNRLADNWRPLFAVAEIAGGDWPHRAATAFVKLTSGGDGETQGDGVALLADVRTILKETGGERIWTEVLCKHLNEMPERPYADMRSGQGINAHRLGKLLGRFKINSRKTRLQGEPKPKQGYYRADFQEAFDRYLPPEGDSKWNIGTRPENIGDSAVSEVEQAEPVFHSQNAEIVNNDAGCSDVPLSKPGEAEGQLSEAMLL